MDGRILREPRRQPLALGPQIAALEFERLERGQHVRREPVAQRRTAAQRVARVDVAPDVAGVGRPQQRQQIHVARIRAHDDLLQQLGVADDFVQRSCAQAGQDLAHLLGHLRS